MKMSKIASSEVTAFARRPSRDQSSCFAGRHSVAWCAAGMYMETGSMPRFVSIAAAQSGPISRQTSRSEVVARLVDQMREARVRGCDLIVFTECALTAFFPHWWIEDEAELDAWFESEMPGSETQPLFDEAARLG